MSDEPRPPASNDAENERLAQFMRAQSGRHLPSEVVSGKDFLTGAAISRDPERLHAQRAGDDVKSGVHREPRQPAFPEAGPTQEVTQVAGTGSSLRASFLLQDATTTEGEPPVVSNKVLVLDGKLDNTFPDGMGFGNYILDLPNPEAQIILVGATFDPKTLALNSRFLDVSGFGDFPESRVESENAGFLYWQLGFTYFDGDGNFIVYNTRLGDIWLELIYGADNAGKPALWAGAQIGWLDLDFM